LNHSPQSPNSLVTAAYVVTGQPHVLLKPDKSPGWRSLNESYAKIRAEIDAYREAGEADLILYFSTQWLSVLGYMFQGDPAPEWTHVDPNFHELGTMRYAFKGDPAFAKAYAAEVKPQGPHTRVVNYRGFPIDTGTIVAQVLLNPDNKLPAAMVSCNMYAEKEETTRVGQAAAHALAKQGRRAIAVVVSNLSNRFEIKDIDPKADRISSLKDDEWNRKVLEMLGEGALEDVAQCTREFARQANADMGGKGFWWLSGLTGLSNDFKGRVFDYQPVWGTGAALVGLYPTKPVTARDYDVSSEEGSQAALVSQLTDRMSTDGHGHHAHEDLDVGQHETVHSPQVPPPPRGSTNTGTAAGTGQPPPMLSKKAPEPVGPYPHARRHGDLLFLSGIGPRTRGQQDIPGVTLDAKGQVTAYDVEIQTRAVFANVKTVLEECGSSLEKVVDVQVFLTDMKRDFATFNRIYGEFFRAESGPTRTTVEVRALPTPIAVELKVIAKP
jgi:reactive intermediate/imine deaminase